MNGLLIVNKPAGVTSHDVVARLRKITGEASIGHLGTLDPMATGVLPLLMGRYTRLARFFGADDKTYTGIIRFGCATDTYDAEGEPIGERSEPPLTLGAIRAQAAAFLGAIEQTPPPFSAKKLNGVPAYKLARQGRAVELRPVRIVVRRFEISHYDTPDATFELTVSSGGYIRSIAHELGIRIGCGAHLAALCRTCAGEFTLARALTLDQIAEAYGRGDLSALMPHPRGLLPDLPCVTVTEQTAGRMRNGMPCNLPEYSRAPLIKIFTGPQELFAIGRRIAGTLIQPAVVLG